MKIAFVLIASLVVVAGNVSELDEAIKATENFLKKKEGSPTFKTLLNEFNEKGLVDDSTYGKFQKYLSGELKGMTTKSLAEAILQYLKDKKSREEVAVQNPKGIPKKKEVVGQKPEGIQKKDEVVDSEVSELDKAIEEIINFLNKKEGSPTLKELLTKFNGNGLVDDSTYKKLQKYLSGELEGMTTESLAEAILEYLKDKQPKKKVVVQKPKAIQKKNEVVAQKPKGIQKKNEADVKEVKKAITEILNFLKKKEGSPTIKELLTKFNAKDLVDDSTYKKSLKYLSGQLKGMSAEEVAEETIGYLKQKL